jgi:glycosyltransferase involved in cell wall biosynthesis
MPKLLIVTTVASTLRAFLLPYARHFREKGWTVDALSSGFDAHAGSECCSAFDRCHEISFSRSPLNRGNFGKTGKRIREIAAEGYDIVHVHTPVAAFVTRMALRDLRGKTDGPKVVYTAHGFHFYRGGNPLKNTAFIALERLAGRWTDHTVTLNREDREAALAHRIARRDTLSLFPGIGLDFSRWSAGNVDVSAIRNARLNLGLEKNDELFLMAAEFIPRKRHRDALRALAMTGRKNFHLAFAGTGPLEPQMKRLAFETGIAPRVHFLGARDDVPLLMLSSRATVLSSEREGLSRSVMESVCLGVPVLGADARGIRDILTPERGTLFPVGNPAALAAAMILATDDPRPRKPAPDPLWRIERLLDEHEKLYRRLTRF